MTTRVPTIEELEGDRIHKAGLAFVAANADYVVSPKNFALIVRWITTHKEEQTPTEELFQEAWDALIAEGNEDIQRKLFDVVDDEEPLVAPAHPAPDAAPLDAKTQAEIDREDEKLSSEAYAKKYGLRRLNTNESYMRRT